MAKLVTWELIDIQNDLPAIVPFSQEATDQSADLFLCALGFEPRCLSIPDALSGARVKMDHSIYFLYSTNQADNSANLSKLKGHLNAVSSSVKPMEVDSPDFPQRLREAIEMVVSENSAVPPHVILDISVFANRLLLKCIKVLLEYRIKLTVLYAEAAIYHPTKEEYAKDPRTWGTRDTLGLERGVGNLETSIDYPGYHLDLLPDCLILFPSFNGDRSKAVISAVDPLLLTNPGEKVYWLLGLPHLEEDRWRISAMETINEIPKGSQQMEVSTFDYKQSMRVLESIYTGMGDRYNLTLSPLGSKLQALGTALFCYLHPEVRILLATPREYNASRYSDGCKALWKIDFGLTTDLLGVLDRVGKIRIED